MTKIDSLHAKGLTRELKSPFKISLGTQTNISNVIIKIKLEDGTTGIGEAAPVSIVTHESQETALAAIELARSLITGMEIENTRGIHLALKHHLETQHSARAGVEMAVFDALCKLWGCSLAELAGGTSALVRTDDTVGLVTPDIARSQASKAIKSGFEDIKIKVGNHIEDDIERVAAVREVAPEVRIIVDGNQGYYPKDAIEFADRTAEFEISLFEQPVNKDNLQGLKQVKDAVRISVAADESVFTAEDAATVAAMEAADVINIKIQKAGIVDALAIASIAEAHGLDLMIGMMLESSIGVTAGAHLAAGTGAMSYVDLDGHFSITDPITEWEYQPTHSVQGPGLGLDIDYETL
jgi:L-alanine-DL-glutamate epimerase-like enolase superfamily enzyme